ncbi:MAG: threonine--tRNA ligase [Methylobacter sp.]|nr:MAG: threonine--tRNA ligase [Methylobacter sp.]PPD03424.1 MAG: threonine--tRNA ligase [Methylobacter sp.]PPD23828.1 MAG: threonine--tRNA ligase [Methylobacter sp.]PPD34633.1 MAG: threonine--tRNA ligase [Methylomonas sp.]
MPVITLPDGSQREYPQAVTVMDIAQSIGSGLAKATLAGKVNGKIVDAAFLVDHDAQVQILTAKDAEGLEIIRHSTAHLLAHAVKKLHPDAQVTIGPVVENGFYYDFSYHRAFTPDDLAAIEQTMQQLAEADHALQRSVLPRDEAVKFFKGQGEAYKAEIIESIPSDEDLSLYGQADFIDLCRGPHVPSTGKLKAFKLMKIAGAYWRGDSKNEMLQRIYGTAWADKKDLQEYLQRLEEAEKRDHRKIGKQLDLFHTQEEAPGMVFWHPKGWTVWQAVEQYMRRVYRENGYQEIRCPQILDVSLWKASGHWDNFQENMFFTGSENREYAVKPMNCPGHVQVYNQHLHSYRELPIRYGEFGSCHRNEPSGTLHGIMRVRSFTQDDGHIFCTEEQIQQEVSAFIALLQKVYHDFGFNEIIYKLSTRPEKRLGSDEIWDKAENALAAALAAQDTEYELQPGEGAFYGPKIEFSLKDCIGRVWQCGTIQVDFSMPNRLGASYIAEDGSKHMPVMLHRAILGSLERFIGILIEQHAGMFPLWLAPVQVMVMTITERHEQYAERVLQDLEKQGFRAKIDLRNEKIGFKIREHSMQRIPYMLVIGDKELDAQAVTVRTQNGQDLGSLSMSQFINRLDQEIADRK